jgi:peptidoglycan/LPS O-acetylase OafA/YrhL
MTKLGYRPALDGVRALAIAPVVTLHAFGWPRNESLGVEIFFVLSGFLITILLLEERVATGTISLLSFYLRRAVRLVPGLVLMLAVYAIVAHGAHAWALVFGLTYTSNIATLVDANAMPWSLGHLWSLAQEEQFYLLWPPLLLLLLARARPALLPKALGILVVAIMIEKLSLVAAGSGIQRIYFAPDTHSEPILIGCLFGALYSRWSPAAVRSWGGPAALLVVIGSVLASQWLWILSPLSPIRTVFFFACGFLILAAAQGEALLRPLGNRVMTFIGQISYSLYLWHVPVLAAAGATVFDHRPGRSVAAILVALAIASASFFYVEQPLRRRWRDPRPARTGTAPDSPPAFVTLSR